ISSVAGYLAEAAILPLSSIHTAAHTQPARSATGPGLERLRLDIGEHAAHVRVEIDDLGHGAGIVAAFEVAELGVAEGAALHELVAARQQIGGGGVIVLDREAEVMHAAGRHAVKKFRVGTLAC